MSKTTTLASGNVTPTDSYWSNYGSLTSFRRPS